MSITTNPVSDDAPKGFTPHFRHSPLTDPWEPLYSRKTEDAVLIGLRIDTPHTNARGFAHGGLIAALADNAMGLSCIARMDTPCSLVTVNLSVDYLGTAKLGQWLEFETSFVKVGTTLCFAQALVTADGTPCAKASATFRTLRQNAAT